MMESKRVFWQFEVEGAFDEEAAKKQLIEETVEILQEATEFAQKIMRKVSKYFFPFQSPYRFNQNKPFGA